MGHVTDLWAQQRCLIWDGVHFPDDTYVPLTGSTKRGYRALARGAIQDHPEYEEDAWGELDVLGAPACQGSYVAVAGEGAYEGVGFVALLRASDRALVWILCLDQLESVNRGVAIVGDTVEAVAECYPVRHEISVPIEEPWRCTILVTKMTDT